MCAVLNAVAERFAKELPIRKQGTVTILFVVSDGEPTDGDPIGIADELKRRNIIIISCYLTGHDIAHPKTLFGKPQDDWIKGARLMFQMASTADDTSDFVRFLLRKGWTIQPDARLFVQVNHSVLLDEFIRIVLSPFETPQDVALLPRGA